MKPQPSEYWDACIASLPPAKRAAAEKALESLSSEEGSGLSLLLLLSEAQGMHASKVISEIADKAARMAVLQSEPGGSTLPGFEEKDLEKIRGLILPLDTRQQISEVSIKLDMATKETKVLNRQVSLLRHFRVGVAVFLILLTVLLTLVGLWLPNRQTVKAAWELQKNGVTIRTALTNDCLVISVFGNYVDAWKNKSDEQRCINVAFPLQK
jgi:hypothetical protein